MSRFVHDSPRFAGRRVRRAVPLHPRPVAGEPAHRGALLTIIRPGRLLQRRLRYVPYERDTNFLSNPKLEMPHSFV